MVDIREWWNNEYEHTDHMARESKDSQSAWFKLSRRYLGLTPKEKEEVTSVLIDWIRSDDKNRRSDSIWLVREHKIIAAKQALEQLRIRLKDCKIPDDPEGYHECLYVNEVLKELEFWIHST